MKNFKVLLSLFLGILVGFILHNTFISPSVVEKEPGVIHDTLRVETSIQLNNAVVYKMILDANINEPEIVLKQTILETGHYQSRSCLEDNNLFGFTDRRGLMKFNSAKECVLWYKQWQSMWYNPIKYRDYYQFLDSIGYARDGTYTDQLKRIAI